VCEKRGRKFGFLWREEEGDFKDPFFVFENCECKWRNNFSKLLLQPGVSGAWNWRSSEFPVLLRYCHFFLTQEKQTSTISDSEYDDFCTFIANLCKGNKWWGSNFWHSGAYGGWGWYRRQSVTLGARQWNQHTTKCAVVPQGTRKLCSWNTILQKSLTNNCWMFSGRNTILLK
jgi:hypothetical protein